MKFIPRAQVSACESSSHRDVGVVSVLVTAIWEGICRIVRLDVWYAPIVSQLCFAFFALSLPPKEFPASALVGGDSA